MVHLRVCASMVRTRTSIELKIGDGKGLSMKFGGWKWFLWRATVLLHVHIYDS